MITQTIAIFVDAYRELNSKKLFWIVLFISLAVVIALGLPSNNEKGIAIFGLTLEAQPFSFFSTKALSKAGFYKLIFANVGVKVWLTWGATILALISTASIFPDMVSSGAIELSLSKPIGRLRLYLTKFAGGMLFVAAQVAIFSLGAFFVIGIRGEKWEFSVFWAVPLALLVFSYLFSVSALVGLITRSPITSLLATMIFWLFLFSVNTIEHVMLQQRIEGQGTVRNLTGQIEQSDKAIEIVKAQLETAKSAQPSGAPAESAAPQVQAPIEPAAPPAAEQPQPRGPRRGKRELRDLTDTFSRLLEAASPNQTPEALENRLRDLERARDRAREKVAVAESSLAGILPWHRGLFAAKTALPKTSETTGLLSRYVIDKNDREGILRMIEEGAQDSGNREFDEALESRSVSWIVLTSLGFEAIVLGLGAWVFCRRDF